MPIAWEVLPVASNSRGSRNGWLCLQALCERVPPTLTVIVLADRGLSAEWLFEGIQQLGWHPLLRVNAGGTFRPMGWVHRYPLTH